MAANRRRLHRRIGQPPVVFLTVVAAVGVLVGCTSGSVEPGSSASASLPTLTDPTPVATTPAVPVNKALAAKVPSAIKSSGKLIIATDPQYPPMSFGPISDPQGVDADLARATGQLLGLKPEFKAIPFAKIRDGVAAGDANIGWSYTTVTAEREKVVAFATYYDAGEAWVTKSGSSFNPDKLCGMNVAVIKGFIYNEQIKAVSNTCQQQGQPAVTVTPVTGSHQGAAMILAGQVEAMPLDSPVAASEIAMSNGKLTQAGTTTDVAPLGVSIAKGSSLGKVIRDAIQALIDGGQYKAILKRWQVPQGAIDKSVLNPKVG